MSATMAQLAQGLLGSLSHRVSLLAPGCGETLIAQSPAFGPKLGACFKACAEFDRKAQNLGLDPHPRLDRDVAVDLSAKVEARMGLRAANAQADSPSVHCQRARTEHGELVGSTYDLRLVCFSSEQRHAWWACQFEVHARFHLPTETVRFVVLFTMEDGAWQGVLAPRPSA